MTQTFAADANGDWFLGPDGNLSILTGRPAVIQLCQAAARTLLNEMMFRQGDGLPYFEAVWTGAPNLTQYETALRAAFLAVQDVTSVSDIALTQTGDELDYVAQINTIYGSVTVAS